MEEVGAAWDVKEGGAGGTRRATGAEVEGVEAGRARAVRAILHQEVYCVVLLCCVCRVRLLVLSDLAVL